MNIASDRSWLANSSLYTLVNSSVRPYFSANVCSKKVVPKLRDRILERYADSVISDSTFFLDNSGLAKYSCWGWILHSPPCRYRVALGSPYCVSWHFYLSNTRESTRTRHYFFDFCRRAPSGIFFMIGITPSKQHNTTILCFRVKNIPSMGVKRLKSKEKLKF